MTEEQDASEADELSADMSLFSVGKLRILKVHLRPVDYVMVLITCVRKD